MRALAVLVEQALAAPFAIGAFEILIDAQREILAVVAARKNERIAPQEGRHIVPQPLTLAAYEEILVIPHTEQHHGDDIFPLPREDHGVLGGSVGELGNHQRY